MTYGDLRPGDIVVACHKEWAWFIISCTRQEGYVCVDYDYVWDANGGLRGCVFQRCNLPKSSFDPNIKVWRRGEEERDETDSA